ncbi:MAG: outer membrane beta-barrel protein [Bacteroidetes bacterium]|nr:outer membrane beta-barrel protein [Bacteroidota bacterium]
MKFYNLPIFFLFFITFLLPVNVIAQTKSDSLHHILKEHNKLFKNILDSIKKIRLDVAHIEKDLTLTGTRIISHEERTQESPKLTIGGYITTYYALYSDTADANNFQKFPTTAPQSNVFGLNLAQISTKYSSRSLRAISVLQYGDMPRSIWSPTYNYIQEANVGIRLLKRVWIDAGLFRTHIGLESIQPRENITSSIAVATFYEPYYLAGAKLSFLLNDKLTLQLNSFNRYNGFTENNKKKAAGFSFVYDVNSNFSLTFNTLWNDDSPDNSKIAKGRLYNNLYAVYKSKRLILGVEVNYAIQQNSHLTFNKTYTTAQMFSSLAEAKFMLFNKCFVYGRGEYFSDPDEALTGMLLNQNKQLIGLNIAGATLGFEYKSFGNTYLRVEGRVLNTIGKNEAIFLYNNLSSNKRYEMITSMGVWF